MTTDSITIDIHTARVVKTLAALALTVGIMFFSYSAYAGAFLGGGSSQIFTGVASLLMVLASCFVIEKIALEKHQDHNQHNAD
ncbi:MAG: hypothetical protein Q8O24_04955 [Gallionellaceae bacterium]|nr:hypothetical protein [Gallionellaceae bacterium]